MSKQNVVLFFICISSTTSFYVLIQRGKLQYILQSPCYKPSAAFKLRIRGMPRTRRAEATLTRF